MLFIWTDGFITHARVVIYNRPWVHSGTGTGGQYIMADQLWTPYHSSMISRLLALRMLLWALGYYFGIKNATSGVS